MFCFFWYTIDHSKINCRGKETKKTDQLIITSPVNISDLILGKFFAALCLFLLTVMVTVLQPMVLSIFGEIPVPKKILGTYIGFVLLGCSLIAIGLFISALANNQMVATVVTYIVFFLGVIFSDTIILTLPKDRTSSILLACLLAVFITMLVYFTVRNMIITLITAILGMIALGMVYLLNPLFYDGFMINFFGWFSLLGRFKKNFQMGF